MGESVSEFIEQQQLKIAAFRKTLTAESDRGCALFAAAYLDVGLSDLLYVSLVTSKSIDRDLFDGTAPLASFSSRIKMAFYLGLISQACRRDLDIIRAVRNDFAHQIDVDSFSTQSIQDHCKSLSFSYHEKDKGPRSHFTAAALGILGVIHGATLSTKPHQQKPDDVPSDDKKDAHRKFVEGILTMLQEPSSSDVSGE